MRVTDGFLRSFLKAAACASCCTTVSAHQASHQKPHYHAATTAKLRTIGLASRSRTRHGCCRQFDQLLIKSTTCKSVIQPVAKTNEYLVQPRHQLERRDSLGRIVVPH